MSPRPPGSGGSRARPNTEDLRSNAIPASSKRITCGSDHHKPWSASTQVHTVGIFHKPVFDSYSIFQCSSTAKNNLVIQSHTNLQSDSCMFKDHPLISSYHVVLFSKLPWTANWISWCSYKCAPTRVLIYLFAHGCLTPLFFSFKWYALLN